ncbi:MAG TPA: hypothetical protein VJP39_04280 [Gaiellaceae bacterium]|nr:hypothetical protein [Gaiellaceae bacterium]
MTERERSEPPHDDRPNPVLVVLAALAIFVIGCALVIAFAIR